MIVSINQPAYLPWLGYFDRIVQSDLHIVLDTVPLEHATKTSFTNRNRIKTAQGASWITVPIKTAGAFQQIISDVKVDLKQKWPRKHMQALISNYSKVPYFNQHRAWFEDFYQHEWTHLAPLLKTSTSYLLNALGIKTSLVTASNMKVSGKKSEYILNLCREAGSTTYLSGPFGRDYLVREEFERAGVKVEYHDYQHPIYDQCYGDFEPYLSIVDLLFNEGPKSLQILREAN